LEKRGHRCACPVPLYGSLVLMQAPTVSLYHAHSTCVQ